MIPICPQCKTAGTIVKTALTCEADKVVVKNSSSPFLWHDLIKITKLVTFRCEACGTEFKDPGKILNFERIEDDKID